MKEISSTQSCRIRQWKSFQTNVYPSNHQKTNWNYRLIYTYITTSMTRFSVKAHSLLVEIWLNFDTSFFIITLILKFARKKETWTSHRAAPSTYLETCLEISFEMGKSLPQKKKNLNLNTHSKTKVIWSQSLVEDLVWLDLRKKMCVYSRIPHIFIPCISIIVSRKQKFKRWISRLLHSIL